MLIKLPAESWDGKSLRIFSTGRCFDFIHMFFKLADALANGSCTLFCKENAAGPRLIQPAYGLLYATLAEGNDRRAAGLGFKRHYPKVLSCSEDIGTCFLHLVPENFRVL